MIKLNKVFTEKVFSFPRGGITFEDDSVPPRTSSVTAFLPSLSIIPMNQHSGTPANPIVSVGQTVKEGMLIGRSKGSGTANIHSSIPGRVIRIVSWESSGGKVNDGIAILMEGSFEKLGKKEEVFPWENMLPHDIQRTIAEFGVVEMDGEARPVSEIISSFRSIKEPVTLVVRCVFDDPWLVADYVLCKERAAAVVEGAIMTARSCKLNRIIYAISHGEKELGDIFLEIAQKWGIPASVVLVGSRYPQRNKRELELVLRNYAKKAGINLGPLFILGPATLAAVYDAVKKQKPVLERYVAVGGSAIKLQQVMKVRIGTRIRDLFAECGGFKGTAPKKIATGSPFLGQLVSNLDEPVIKTSFAFFAIFEEIRRNNTNNCISCGECRSVCPVGLDPEDVYKRILISGNENSLRINDSCHGCGCCEVVCPSRLPLSTVISSVGFGGHDA